MILELCWHNKYSTSLLHVGERTTVCFSEMLTIYHVQVVMLYSNPFNEHSGIVLMYHTKASRSSQKHVLMIIISVKYIQIHQLFFNKFNLITTSGLIGQKELHCFFIKTMLLGIHFKYTHASPFISLSFSCIYTKHNTVSFVDFIFSFGFFPFFSQPSQLQMQHGLSKGHLSSSSEQ